MEHEIFIKIKKNNFHMSKYPEKLYIFCIKNIIIYFFINIKNILFLNIIKKFSF